MAKGVKGSSPIEDVPIRTSFIIKPSITRKLKYIAMKDQTTQTAIIEVLTSEFIKRWEKKYGEIEI